MRDIGLEVFIDGKELSLVVKVNADGVEVKIVNITDPAHSVEKLIGVYDLAALKPCHDLVSALDFDTYDLFTETQGRRRVAHPVLERLDYLAVGKAKQLISLLDDSYLHAQAGEDAGVFAANNPAPYYGEPSRDAVEVKDGIAIVDVLCVKRDALGPCRGRACGDDDNPCPQLLCITVRAFYQQHMLIDKGRLTVDDLNIVASKMVSYDLHLPPYDLGLFVHDLAKGYVSASGATAASFVSDHISSETGERLYRTGDLVRHGPDGALEFLWSRPFREMTVAELMSISGASRPAFYQYFDDLHNLMETLLRGLEENIFEAAVPWFSGEGDPTALLQESLAGLVRVCYERGPILRAVADASPSDERLELAWAEFLAKFDDAVAARIEEQQENGLISPFDARPIAIALNRLDASLLIHAFGRRPRGNPEPVREAITRIWTSTLYESENR